MITVSGSGAPVTSPYRPTFHGDVWLETLDEEPDCDALNDPLVPVLQGDGSVVLTPLACPSQFAAALPVPGNAFPFTYNTTTADSDPGDGTIRLNNATISSVTRILVDLVEFNGTTITDWLDSLGSVSGSVKGRVRLYDRTDQSNWADFTLTGVTSATGYRKLDVTYVDHNGTFDNTPGNLVLDFTPAGTAGSNGAPGDWTSPQSIVSITADHDLELSDAGKYLRSTSAVPITITVPTNADEAFAVGTHIDFIQAGTGTVSFDGDVGVTINASPGFDITGQWGAATLIKVGTNEWDLVGNLTA